MVVTIGVSPLLARQIRAHFGLTFGRGRGDRRAPAPSALRRPSARRSRLPERPVRALLRMERFRPPSRASRSGRPAAPSGRGDSGAGGRARPRGSLIYLPPAIDRRRRYPVVYLLHGIRGAPYSFPGGLGLTAIADHLIASRRIRPFIAVMPPAGANASFRGEWTGYLGALRRALRRASTPIARCRRSRRPGPGHRRPLCRRLRRGRHRAPAPRGVRNRRGMERILHGPHDGSLAHASARALAAHDPRGSCGDRRARC